jgi:hypothetical protein
MIMKCCERLIKSVIWLTTLAAMVCVAIAYWDVIEAWFFRLRDKCVACKMSASKEAEDFADWDDE